MTGAVVIAGGHGRIARLLTARLVDAGTPVRGLVRSPEHVSSLEALGAEGVLADLEGPVAGLRPALEGAAAIVFAAGAGPGSGLRRKITVDLEGAVKLVESAEAGGPGRFVMVSAMRADEPDEGAEPLRAYLVAKGGADARLMRSSLAWTVIRPGRLTDADPTGRVRIGDRLERGEIARADVAGVIAAVLDSPGTVGRAFDVINGETPIADALSVAR